ncbi:MAG: cell division ATP-binding protein FtsE [bacterium]
MIRLKNVTKSYGDLVAVNDMDLHIKVGDFVFLVGQSGAGKSTLMRLIYREEIADEGQVLIGGVDVSHIKHSQVPRLRRCMGIVFQDFKLLPKQTAHDNVAYVIRALGMSSSEIDRRVKGALKVVGLADKEFSYPNELSGGEQQRIGIARAIVNGPPLLIADEPTGNLDPQNSFEIMEILEQINQRGTTVVVSTHDEAIVNHYKKRVVKLEKGRIISDVYSGTYQ